MKYVNFLLKTWPFELIFSPPTPISNSDLEFPWSILIDVVFSIKNKSLRKQSHYRSSFLPGSLCTSFPRGERCILVTHIRKYIKFG